MPNLPTRNNLEKRDSTWLEMIIFPNTPQVCLCQSNYFAAPDQVGASSAFSVKSFPIFFFLLSLFLPKSLRLKRKISCEISCAQVHRFGIVTTNSCRVRFWAHTACIWRSMPLNKSVKTILLFALTHVLSNRSRLDKHLVCGRSLLQAVTGWSAASRVPLANSLSHTGGEHLASSGKAGDQSHILPISFHFDVSPFRERAHPLSAVQPHHPEGPGYSWSHRLWVLRHRKPSRQRSGW